MIGGDAGGMAAASQARRRKPYMEIVALEKGDRTSYSACGIPYLVSGDVASPDELIARYGRRTLEEVFVHIARSDDAPLGGTEP